MKPDTDKADKKQDIIITLSKLFVVVFGFTFIFLTFYMLIEYNSDKKLPLLISSSYFTIAFSTISLFISILIYSTQENPITKKEKLISITTLVTILVSLFFILKDTLFLDEIPLNIKAIITLLLLILFLLTIAIRFVKEINSHIRHFNNGCKKRFKEFFSYNRKR